MITTQLELERCLCKNSHGSYNVFEALQYNAYCKNPRLLWQQIQSEYAFMLEEVTFYFLTDEVATDAEGINLVLEVARRIQFD
ncbi:hypothetical protein PCC7424_4472 [Gloeothece citriformis PCC 7424]|uniref:Uncharacterized protein n=1 Tax=Gloeothece citriformis (strain PCC 7424) TaxID=65393 RepID=B7K967_GLOC7|nr:hypothetical protein [Gloeothece citriformis]ACK72836.1 hypothetical protein PCC7424_4472 [Gloeothece citriformis PCC 7424]